MISLVVDRRAATRGMDAGEWHDEECYGAAAVAVKDELFLWFANDINIIAHTLPRPPQSHRKAPSQCEHVLYWKWLAGRAVIIHIAHYHYLLCPGDIPSPQNPYFMQNGRMDWIVLSGIICRRNHDNISHTLFARHVYSNYYRHLNHKGVVVQIRHTIHSTFAVRTHAHPSSSA